MAEIMTAEKNTRLDNSGNPLIRLRTELRKHFGHEAESFVDPLMWLLGHISVDILRLDYWLQKRNPDYNKDESMRSFIRRKHGRSAERFVEHWLIGENKHHDPQKAERTELA